MESLEGWKRSHTCGELVGENSGQVVTLMGWVHRRRDHGDLIFVDLRDRYGMTQIVFNPENKEIFQKAKDLRGEFVIAARGEVRRRPAGLANKNLGTGDIEVTVQQLKVLNRAKTPPFEIDENIEVSEEIRLKYRYIDLRNASIKNNLLIRHKTAQIFRDYFNRNNFVEVETPILMRSTPEGARDYLVPSRIHHGRFYALPQSPQTYKQLLMTAGMDRYYQIVRCFRDEDLRADRQPEFTQVDVEMSFIERDDILAMVEGVMTEIFDKVLGHKLEIPVRHLTYAEAIRRFGTDKPDLRYGMEVVDISASAANCDFKVFTEGVSSGGTVCGICLSGGAKYSRKQIDVLTAEMKHEGAKGLVAIKVGKAGWDSPLVKFFSDNAVAKINDAFAAGEGDLLLIFADEKEKAFLLSGSLRTKLARREELIPDNEYALCWVTDFPLLEYDEDEKRYVARHHPFTAPMDDDRDHMESEPAVARAKAYDLVLNGYEIAGGSIRIHDREMQDRMFRLLDISEEEAADKFGFLLEAFEYGTPPHGGIAFGFDRLIMILANENSIRKVIAFPKTNSALSLMDGAPSNVKDSQLAELGLKIL